MYKIQLPLSTCWNWQSPLHIPQVRPQSSSSVTGWVVVHIAKDHKASSGSRRPWRLAILLYWTVWPWRWRHYDTYKCHELVTKHSITFNKTGISSNTTTWTKSVSSDNCIHHAHVGPEFVVQPTWYTHSKTLQAEATNCNKLKLHHTVTSPQILCLI